MKKLVMICLIVFLGLGINSAKAHLPEDMLYILINSSLDYQGGLGINDGVYRNSVDLNVNFLLLNFGYNYQFLYKSSLFGGIGIGSLIQFQYGYCFGNESTLMRIRSDIPLYSVVKNKESILNYFSVGLYFERAFHFDEQGSSLGFSVGLSLGPLLDKIHRD